MPRTKTKTSKAPKTNKLSIFDWLKEISYNKSPWSKFSDEDKKSFEPYMINRFLSMSESYIELVNYVQTIPYTEKEKYYILYCSILPKKQFFSKYIKSAIKQPDVDLIENLAYYFECSKREIEDYLNILSDENVKGYLTDMGIENKTKKNGQNNGTSN
jgi:hypothetical protein